MFKSSENLRLAAEMRALTRVASPWREARATWFDGTPESLEARLAATDKVLVHARSGFTAAHLALTDEALTARRELIEARHRLLTDFLDDGARAFKGSKRIADALYDHQPGRTYHYAPTPRSSGGTSEEEFEVPPEELVDFIQNHRGGHADDVYHTDPNWPNSRNHLPSRITDEWSGDPDVSGLPEQHDWTGDYKYKNLA